VLEIKGTNNMRVILDTNLWISFLISDKLKFLDQLIETNKLKLLFSEESIEEFIDVVSRPKFKKYFSKKDIEKTLHLFDEFGLLITISSNFEICRDPKDNFLLNLAVDGNADYLISGDDDLLILNTINSTKILSFSDFLNELI